MPRHECASSPVGLGERGSLLAVGYISSTVRCVGCWLVVAAGLAHEGVRVRKVCVEGSFLHCRTRIPVTALVELALLTTALTLAA